MAATMIYPGVYVEQPSVKPNTKAYKYLSMYSDVRFQNWQLSLELAADDYKRNMSAYEAELRATQQTVAAARKSVDSIQADIERLQATILSTAEKEQATNVAALNSGTRFNASQTNASARSAYAQDRSDARSSAYLGTKPPNVWDQTTLDAARSTGATVANQNNEDNGYEAFTASAKTKPGTAASGTDNLWAQRYYFEARMKDKGLNPDAPADIAKYTALLGSRNKDAFLTAMEYKPAVPVIDSSSGSSVKGKPDTTLTGTRSVSYDETQKARMRQLYALGGMSALAGVVPADTKPEELLKLLGIPETVSALDRARADLEAIRAPAKPVNDIIGTARSIYGENFEALPGYKRQQQYRGTVNTIDEVMTRFAQKRVSMLPADASATDIRNARQEAYTDAAIWITDPSYTPTWLKAPTSPYKASTPTETATGIATNTEPPTEAPKPSNKVSELSIQEVRLPDDDQYVYAYDKKSDEYIVIYGPDSIGARFAPDSKAYKKLAAEGVLGEPTSQLPLVDVYILGETDYQYKFDPNKGVFVIAGGPANVGREYGRGTTAYEKLIEAGIPGKMSTKTVEAEEPAAPTKSPGVQKIEAILAGTYKPSPQPLEDKPTAPSKPVDVFALSGLPEFGALMATLPTREREKPYVPPVSAKVKDTDEKVQSLIGGGELATKPRKVARLSATSWGTSVDNLYTANKKSSTPLEFSQLRDQILISYRDYPKQADRMIELLAAKYIVDNLPVSQQVK